MCNFSSSLSPCCSLSEVCVGVMMIPPRKTKLIENFSHLQPPHRKAAHNNRKNGIKVNYAVFKFHLDPTFLDTQNDKKKSAGKMFRSLRCCRLDIETHEWKSHDRNDNQIPYKRISLYKMISFMRFIEK